MGVLVLVEHEGGQVDELSLQALALARRLGEPAALLVGGRDAAAQLGAHGVATAYVAEDERLAAYAPGAWARCIEDLIERLAPTAVVAAGTNRGNEVLAHFAARRDLPFAANVTAIGAAAASSLTVTRIRWGGLVARGGARCTARCRSSPSPRTPSRRPPSTARPRPPSNPSRPRCSRPTWRSRWPSTWIRSPPASRSPRPRSW